MTRTELTRIVSEELSRIAPEIDFEGADKREDLREAFEIDSMDFQNLVTALHDRLNIPIPEADYDKLGTIEAVIDYLVEETGDLA